MTVPFPPQSPVFPQQLGAAPARGRSNLPVLP